MNRGNPVLQVLLATQKVVGSNPISLFAKGPYLQVFFVRPVGWCVCVAVYPLCTRRRIRGGSA
jgi:hypothetical protein